MTNKDELYTVEKMVERFAVAVSLYSRTVIKLHTLGMSMNVENKQNLMQFCTRCFHVDIVHSTLL